MSCEKLETCETPSPEPGHESATRQLELPVRCVLLNTRQSCVFGMVRTGVVQHKIAQWTEEVITLVSINIQSHI